MIMVMVVVSVVVVVVLEGVAMTRVALILW